MNDWHVRQQQWSYMRYNLVIFTIIFGLFALIIYINIQQSLYSRLDEELYSSREAIGRHSGFIDSQLRPGEDFFEQFEKAFREKGNYGGRKPPSQENEPPDLSALPKDAAPPVPSGENPPPEGESQPGGDKGMVPMRMQIIIRDAEGAIHNGYTLGRFFWEDTLEEIPFFTDALDTIQSFRMSEGSRYRSIAFAQEDWDGNTWYVQLLANADGEQGIIDSFLSILIVSALGFILLSIFASYLISRKSMAPLIRAWRRQLEFVENASHELRTPLTILQNKLESLLVTPNATILDKADHIAISLSETRRLSRLTADLMTLARADSSELLLQKEPVLLDGLIETVSGPYGELAEAQEKVLKLELAFGEHVEADRGRIHELMVILLDNALKYTREGGTIRISTAQRDKWVVIRVADDGIGIGQESLERIFDRFYREDKARSREHGGTGLGLSIAQWIVQSHNGTIKAEQNQPAGTVFEVRIPK